jgi:nitrogen fixation/metabolism regulation signal transduction histidine kinase
MIFNPDFSFKKIPPVWFWLGILLFSIAGIFYFGLNPQDIDNWWWLLAFYNALMAMLAIFYIIISIASLKRKIKHNIIGSRFTWSFVKIMPVLIIMPVLSFYLFSFQSIQDNALNAQKTFDNFSRSLSSQSKLLQNELKQTEDEKYKWRSEKIVTMIFKYTNRTVSDIVPFLQTLVEDKWACEIRIQHKQTQGDIVTKNTCQPNQAVVNINSGDFTISIKHNTNLQDINATNKFNQFNRFISNIHFSVNTLTTQRRFMIDFSSTILLTILAMIMLVHKMFQRIMKPLNDLSLATNEIAKGNYDVEVLNQKTDKDMHQLLGQFNNMSRQIRLSRQGLDIKNVYLESILKHSFGVVALDKDKKIRLINPPLGKMLGLQNLEEFVGKQCSFLAEKHPALEALFALFKVRFEIGQSEWSESLELPLRGKTALLSCQGSVLNTDSETLGYVVVLRDSSKL